MKRDDDDEDDDDDGDGDGDGVNRRKNELRHVECKRRAIGGDRSVVNPPIRLVRCPRP